MNETNPAREIALVTGASSGIGKEIVLELIKQGHLVIGLARSHEKLNLLQQQFPNDFVPLVCDVSSLENITHASQTISDLGFCPTLFFLNAGIAGENAVESPDQFDLSIHRKIMDVNYFGVLGWVEYWEKPCLKNGGANFIVTSSINAFFAPPCGSGYSASKAAIAKAFESLSLTYYDTGLRFSVVYPGPVQTPGLKGKLPFTWSAQKMGKKMVEFAFSEKNTCEPSFFYKIITRLFRLLPPQKTLNLLRDD